ncbi:hypothetical protein CAXC1_150006 [Candidatus Xenohaliotis californiensis]|uniref:Uncharacterized protein n=1 Tax=Candidatus Xenohaliotis californiensis TaxID=84677 RepID=A0ABM9N747_9RICK|nr:hypothetical protein CAXC1_150006 [Candidatus Xenohaliotis californiensis]
MSSEIEVVNKLDSLLEKALRRFENDIDSMINRKILSFNEIFEKEIRTIVSDLYKLSMQSAANNIVAQLGDDAWLKEIVRIVFHIAFGVDIGGSTGLAAARQSQPGAKQIVRDVYNTIFYMV